jgi:hypothetical protein
MLKRVAVRRRKGALRTDRPGACRPGHNLIGFGYTAANLLKAGRGPLLGSDPFASLQDEKAVAAPKVEEADKEGPFGVHPQPQ